MDYEFDFASVLVAWPQFLEGAWLTIQLSFPATVLGFVAGTLLAIGRRSHIGWLTRLCGAYVEVIRNTPLLVQVFLVFFGLSSLGWKVSAFSAALASLVINVAAYSSEIMRAGMDSIHKGQLEAAECLGLTRRQVYWHVILRPAMEKVYPALTSQFVLLMLATSITSQISVEELTAVAARVQSETFRPFEAYILVAVAYLLLSLLMRLGLWLFGQIVFTRQRKLGTSGRRTMIDGGLNLLHLKFLLIGALWTVCLSLIAFIGGGLAGGVVALCRVSPVKAVRWAAIAWIQVIQGTPLLVVLFVCYFGLSIMGYELPGLVAAGIAMVVYVSAYLGEIWRGCIESVPRTQWEAAECLALTRTQRMRLVVLPQAIRIATPPTVGFMVQIVKNTSLASIVGFVELVRAGQLINNSIFQPFQVYLLIAVMYFAMCYPLSVWSRRLEQRLQFGARTPGQA